MYIFSEMRASLEKHSSQLIHGLGRSNKRESFKKFYHVLNLKPEYNLMVIKVNRLHIKRDKPNTIALLTSLKYNVCHEFKTRQDI